MADVVDHRPAVQRSGSRRAEYILVVQVMAVVYFLAATVQVAQHRSEVDAGRIDQRLFREIERRLHGQQLAADGADRDRRSARVHQRLNEARQQQDIGIQCQNPIAARHADRLVLGSGEADVFRVVDYTAAIGELLEDVDGPIGRRCYRRR